MSILLKLKDFYGNLCVPLFSIEEITNNISKAKVREVNRWDKHCAEIGKSSHCFKKYQQLKRQGFTLSKVSCGEREGELCLYNRKTDVTIFANQY